MKEEDKILKDALRYRWLRDTNHYREVESCDDDTILNVGMIDRICIVVDEGLIQEVDQDDFDKIIDQAMIDWIKK
jgi:hypothetical protein